MLIIDRHRPRYFLKMAALLHFEIVVYLLDVFNFVIEHGDVLASLDSHMTNIFNIRRIVLNFINLTKVTFAEETANLVLVLEDRALKLGNPRHFRYVNIVHIY